MKQTTTIAAIILQMLLTTIVAKAQLVAHCDDIRLYALPATTAADTTGTAAITAADSVQLAFSLHFDGKPLGSKQAYVLTPRLVGVQDSIDFPSIGVYGHDIYYHYLRTAINVFQTDADMMFRAKYCPIDTAYRRAVAYQPWMQRATLKLVRTDITACGDITDSTTGRHA